MSTATRPTRVDADSVIDAMRSAMTETASDRNAARLDSLAIPPEPETCTITCAEPAIPARFRAARLTQFRDSLADNPDPEVRASQMVAFDAVKDWCKRTHAGEPAMLALVGATGVGKSHLLYAATYALYRRNVRVYAQPWYRLADALRYGGRSAWGTNKLLEAPEVRDEILGERVICLDDVRPTSGTAFDDTELGKIILDAWDRESAMLITTNCSPLTSVLSPPLASRFVQVVMTGPDRRAS
jgi:DNA replication protein DnaC